MSFLTGLQREPMSRDERLLYEARVRRRQAVIAALAGLLLVAGAVFQLLGPHTKVDELTLNLITANKRVGLDIVAVVLNALGLVALALTLVFLFSATRSRAPASQPFPGIFAIVGGVGGAIMGIVNELLIASKAHTFATTGAQTYQGAHHLTSSAAFAVVPLLGLVSALLLALALVLVSLGAMRVGLLTRFMGYLGMFAGALVLFQITQVPVVQAYWLLALAYLFSGRWPTGVPPAWRSGRAEKWPSSQEMREQRIRAAGGAGRGKATPAPQPVTTPATPSATRPQGAKRKRKRRK